MCLRTRNRRNPAKVVRITWCVAPAGVLPIILPDAVRPGLVAGTLQQKVKDVVGKSGILGKPQMIGKNKVHLAPVNR